MSPRRKFRNKPLGEVDLKEHVRVYIPTARGAYALVWVKILKGTNVEGEGIIDHQPKVRCRCDDGPLTLGTVIRYKGGTERVRPKFARKVHVANATPKLLENIAMDLKQAMAFNPGKR